MSGRQWASSEAVVVLLETALQTVRCPETYLHTDKYLLPSHRAALAERAKAMTGLYLFMLEGLVEARHRFREKGICDVPSMVHAAWLRYLQLHGRQAGIAVPMDGWLCSDFPAELLTNDRAILDLLANSVRLGGTEQASVGIEVPDALLVPAYLFGGLVEDHAIPNRIAELLTPSATPIGSSIRRFGNDAREIPSFRRLSSDFVAIVSACRLPACDFRRL